MNEPELLDREAMPVTMCLCILGHCCFSGLAVIMAPCEDAQPSQLFAFDPSSKYIHPGTPNHLCIALQPRRLPMPHILEQLHGEFLSIEHAE